MTSTTLAILAAVLGQGYQAVQAAPAGAPGDPDFRVYIFVAYGIVVLLLLLFSLWSVVQTSGAERKLGQLEERLRHAIPKESS